MFINIRIKCKNMLNKEIVKEEISDIVEMFKYFGKTKEEQLLVEQFVKKGVVEKLYKEERTYFTQNSLDSMGNLTMGCGVQVLPEEYNTFFKIKGKNGKDGITLKSNKEEIYNKFRNGDKVKITYKETKKIFLDHIPLPDGSFSYYKLILPVNKILESKNYIFISAKKIA